MRKSSYEWQVEAQNFFGWSPNPKTWFEFLTWITALSTLHFLIEKTNSMPIILLYIISYAVFFNYLQKRIWSTKFQLFIPKNISIKTRRILTYIISTVVVSTIYLLIAIIVEDIAKSFK